MSDLVQRALRYYNVGEGLTRAEIVDMARRLEALEEIRQRVADGWTAHRDAQDLPYWSDELGEPEFMPESVASLLWPEDTGS